jgi:hypothetical protein
MSKKLSFVLVLVVLFVAVSSVNSQESATDMMTQFVMNIPENCQDGIERFPENLRNGWERGYIAGTSTGQISDADFLGLIRNSLLANFIKTNIILKGKGNERVGDSDRSFSQIYAQLKVGPLGAASMFRMLTAVTGNSGGVNWDAWEQSFLEFL